MLAGIPTTPTATRSAAISPASAARPAEARPEASNPSKTKTGSAANSVETGQEPAGS